MKRDKLDFATMKIGPLFRALFFPTLIGMIFTSLITVIDGMFVGHGVGADGIASVNIVAPTFMISTGIGLMFGIGASVIASIKLSENNVKAAKIILTQSFIASTVLALLMVCVMLLAPHSTLNLLGCSDELYGNAYTTLTHNPVLRKSAYAGMLFNGLGRPLKLDGYSATLPASMGGNKTPIIDENALYDGKAPWIEDYRDRVEKDSSIARTEIVPDYLRRMTVDEARVIQTFPLEYKFCGSQSAQYTQIGNAVPCNLSKAVCSMVIDVIKGTTPIIYSRLF